MIALLLVAAIVLLLFCRARKLLAELDALPWTWQPRRAVLVRVNCDAAPALAGMAAVIDDLTAQLDCPAHRAKHKRHRT